MSKALYGQSKKTYSWAKHLRPDLKKDCSKSIRKFYKELQRSRHNEIVIGLSSNGRTTDFDSVNGGSIPSDPDRVMV